MEVSSDDTGIQVDSKIFFVRSIEIFNDQTGVDERASDSQASLCKIEVDDAYIYMRRGSYLDSCSLKQSRALRPFPWHWHLKNPRWLP